MAAMAPALRLALLLGLLGLLWDPGGATKVLHSLRNLHVAVSEPSPGIPQFMSIGYLDGIPFTRYDSERGRKEPLTEWIKDGAEPTYWDKRTQTCKLSQHMAARHLERLQDWYNQSRGLHTVQKLFGCDLMSDGTIRGYYRDSYNGRDFSSFDLGSRRFVAADSAAEVTRNEVERWTNYLKYECPERLQKYIGYRQKELDSKEPPDVHVSGKEEHGTLILSCHAYGFYPKTIAVNWMKGDEIQDQETEWGEVVPNSDGTFHTWVRIEVRPEEREQYRCKVEHPGMSEPGIFTWGEAGNMEWGNWEFGIPKWGFPTPSSPSHISKSTSGVTLTVVVALSIIAAIIIIGALIGLVIWRHQSGKDRSGYSMAAGNDVGAKA